METLSHSPKDASRNPHRSLKTPHIVDEDIANLTRAMSSGDVSAFRRFFASYFQRLYTYSNRLTQGNQALAEDVCQEVLLRIARNVKKFETEEAFWCWIVLLARCSFIDAIRKERRYSTLLENYKTEHEITLSPAGKSIDSAEALHCALMRLRPNERRLLLAKYQDEESYREIAQTFGLSEKAVESRLSRLRSKLRDILRSYDYRR